MWQRQYHMLWKIYFQWQNPYQCLHQYWRTVSSHVKVQSRKSFQSIPGPHLVPWLWWWVSLAPRSPSNWPDREPCWRLGCGGCSPRKILTRSWSLWTLHRRLTHSACMLGTGWNVSWGRWRSVRIWHRFGILGHRSHQQWNTLGFLDCICLGRMLSLWSPSSQVLGLLRLLSK